jgi:hypothetical protein
VQQLDWLIVGLTVTVTAVTVATVAVTAVPVTVATVTVTAVTVARVATTACESCCRSDTRRLDNVTSRNCLVFLCHKFVTI